MWDLMPGKAFPDSLGKQETSVSRWWWGAPRGGAPGGGRGAEDTAGFLEGSSRRSVGRLSVPPDKRSASWDRLHAHARGSPIPHTAPSSSTRRAPLAGARCALSCASRSRVELCGAASEWLHLAPAWSSLLRQGISQHIISQGSSPPSQCLSLRLLPGPPKPCVSAVSSGCRWQNCRDMGGGGLERVCLPPWTGAVFSGMCVLIAGVGRRLGVYVRFVLMERV